MGPGWEADVWENFGYHYQVYNGRTEIHVRTRGSHISGEWTVHRYSAWIDLDPPPGVASPLQFMHNADTPEDALNRTVQDARDAILKISNQLTVLLYDGPDDASGSLLPTHLPGR